MAEKNVHDDLEKAKQKILEEQQAVIEEERLKILLQIAGATANELNQPLTALLGYIELLKLDRKDPEKLDEHIKRIEEAGNRICDISRKIQHIRHCDTRLPAGGPVTLGVEHPLHILFIEDAVSDFEKIRDILRDRKQIDISRATGIRDAVDMLRRTHFDMVFLEFFLPDGDGLDYLRLHEQNGFEIPVVVITGQGNELIASQVIQKGAYDYLPKHLVNAESLCRSITNALEKYHLKRTVLMAQKKMAEMSTKDALTGLFNRRYFMEALERELARAARYQSEVVLCMLDVDHFKRVNDTYGHPAGDAVLSEIGAMLREYIRESDLLCRYGGEEFAIILTNTDRQEAHLVCERFREMVAWHEFAYDVFSIHMTVSVGISSYEGATNPSADELIQKADEALYRAKNGGRNRVVEHTDKDKWHRPKLGKVLVSEGFVSDVALAKALSVQKLRIGDILVRGGRITFQQLNRALNYQKKISGRLGQLLRQLGYATQEDITWALTKKKRKLGQVMLEQGLIRTHQLQWALAIQSHEPKQLQ